MPNIKTRKIVFQLTACHSVVHSFHWHHCNRYYYGQPSSCCYVHHHGSSCCCCCCYCRVECTCWECCHVDSLINHSSTTLPDCLHDKFGHDFRYSAFCHAHTTAVHFFHWLLIKHHQFVPNNELHAIHLCLSMAKLRQYIDETRLKKENIEQFNGSFWIKAKL